MILTRSRAPGLVEPIEGGYYLERSDYLVTLWCSGCRRTLELEDTTPETITRARDTHRCDPRSSAWDGNR